jgi:hypothetical protein
MKPGDTVTSAWTVMKPLLSVLGLILILIVSAFVS